MALRTTICKPSEVATYLGLASTATDAQMALIEMLQPMVDAAIKTFLGYEVVLNNYEHILPDTDLFQIGYDNIGYPIDVIQNRIAYGMPGQPLILQLPEIPVRSVQALYADYTAAGGQNPGDFAANTALVQGTDYYVDYDGVLPTQQVPFMTGVCWSGHLKRWLGGVWPMRQRTMLVKYTAGISPDEFDGIIPFFPSRRVMDIKLAAIMACAAEYNQAKATGVNGLGAQGPIISESVGYTKFTYSETSVAQMTGMMTQLPMAVQLRLQPHARIKR